MSAVRAAILGGGVDRLAFEEWPWEWAFDPAEGVYETDAATDPCEDADGIFRFYTASYCADGGTSYWRQGTSGDRPTWDQVLAAANNQPAAHIPADDHWDVGSWAYGTLTEPYTIVMVGYHSSSSAPIELMNAASWVGNNEPRITQNRSNASIWDALSGGDFVVTSAGSGNNGVKMSVHAVASGNASQEVWFFDDENGPDSPKNATVTFDMATYTQVSCGVDNTGSADLLFVGALDGLANDATAKQLALAAINRWGDF